MSCAQRRRPLFTIGHSNHSIEHFLELLRRHGVEVIADVRSRPYSRFVPHFGRERLARLLDDAGLGYLFLGSELGGKPLQDDSPQARLDYPARTREPSFQRGIETLLDVLAERQVALMCRERDPLDCHRLHLICRHLRPMALDIRHILPDGDVEVQQATERRLLERAEKRQLNLFDDPDRAALERAHDSWWQARAH